MVLLATQIDSSDTIGDVLKFVQIIFYLVAGCVAVLTYRAAIQGWLTPVNTEYQKRVMDRLAKLSEDLYLEVDNTSDKFWYRNLGLDDAIESLNQSYLSGSIARSKDGKFSGLSGVPVTQAITRMENEIRQIRSDPFIPEAIREAVRKMLKGRFDAFMKAYEAECRDYAEKLAYEKLTPQHNAEFSNRFGRMVTDRLDSTDWYIEKVAGAVADIREMIQQHFAAFDPHAPRSRTRKNPQT